MDFKHKGVQGSAILSAWNAGRQAEKERADKAKENIGARMYAGAKVYTFVYATSAKNSNQLAS